MVLDIQKALKIWITDEGYRKINSYLSNNTEYRYHSKQDKNIDFEDEIYSTEEVVRVIKDHMRPAREEETYYRGGSTNSKKSFYKSTFISVSTDKEQAESFIDGDCCLFRITVDPNVKRIRVGVENEVLLENNLFWEYLGESEDGEHLVKIHTHLAGESIRPSELASHHAVASLTHPPLSHDKDAELMGYYKELKEENDELELDEEITPSDLIAYITSVTNGRTKISHEKAVEIIKRNLDSSTAKGIRKTIKTTKKRKTKKTTKKRKTIKKRKTRKSNKRYISL